VAVDAVTATAVYSDSVWYRITKGAPQPDSRLWRAAVQSTRDAALQRLADRVAADPALYTLLVHEYDLTLVAGEVGIAALTPVLLVSKASRENWRVTMTGVRFPLKYRENRSDLDNLPPTQDYYFYTIHNSKLIVRMPPSDIPSETAVQFFSNSIPLINDPVLDPATGELYDNLIDIGVALIMESASLSEVIRQAEMATGDAPSAAQPAA